MLNMQLRLLFQRFGVQWPTLIGAALLLLALDMFILVYRLIGWPRPFAIYAGLLTFVMLGWLLGRQFFRPCSLPKSGEDTHA